MLLIGSLSFYAWGETVYVLFLMLSIVVNYILGRIIASHSTGFRNTAFTAGIFLNLSMLAIFKYSNFLVEALNLVLFRFNIPPVTIGPTHLPLGISFFTFQAISYLFDVYRGTAPAEKSILSLGVYISMFPQLVAGPIVRFHTIYREIYHRVLNEKEIARGIKVFIVGLSQKVLVANTVAVAADKIFELPIEHIPQSISWLGAICYTLQIYFDFAGYSNMAIGLGLILGFHFPQNFNYPYFSQSITDFWRRWHITLSNWFRDYLYIPLGGSRCGHLRTYINLFIVFALCGFWHGASHTFIIWGLFHGFFIVLERIGLSKVLLRIGRPWTHAYVLCVVLVGWVFFRSESLNQAIYYLQIMFGMNVPRISYYQIWEFLRLDTAVALVVGTLFSCPILPFIRRQAESILHQFYPAYPDQKIFINTTLSLLGITGIFLLVAMSLAAGAHNPFIYYRF